MGVKHGRDYEHILADLIQAVSRIPDSYTFFEMEVDEWQQLDENAHREVYEALAEDVFYALGTEPVLTIGSGVVMHDSAQHCIHFLIGEQEISTVSLI